MLSWHRYGSMWTHNIAKSAVMLDWNLLKNDLLHRRFCKAHILVIYIAAVKAKEIFENLIQVCKLQ